MAKIEHELLSEKHKYGDITVKFQQFQKYGMICYDEIITKSSIIC